MKVLKSGGLSLLIFLICVIVLIVSQNGLALGLASLLGIDPYIGFCTGSIPMVGGHGTAGAFGPVLEDLGLVGATTLCTAAATFGLLAGPLMGGPLGRRQIWSWTMNWRNWKSNMKRWRCRKFIPANAKLEMI